MSAAIGLLGSRLDTAATAELEAELARIAGIPRAEGYTQQLRDRIADRKRHDWMRRQAQ